MLCFAHLLLPIGHVNAHLCMEMKERDRRTKMCSHEYVQRSHVSPHPQVSKSTSEKAYSAKNSKDPCLFHVYFYICQKNQHKMGIQVSSMKFCFHAFRITFKELTPDFSVITVRLIHIPFQIAKS